MSPAEAATLLAIAASFDNRKPDADAATAWAMALNGLRFVDCREAIVNHYGRSTEWLMPAMVRAEVKRIRDRRLAAASVTNPPPGADPDDTAAYQLWLTRTRESIASGEVQPAPAELPRTHTIPDLAALLPRVPVTVTTAKAADPDYAAKRAAAEAELENHPARTEGADA